MGTEEYFPCMKVDKMFYFGKLEYFCVYFLTQCIHVRCPRQIVVNYYYQHSMVLYLFNAVALHGQRVEIRHYILPFFCLVVVSMNFVSSGCRAM